MARYGHETKPLELPLYMRAVLATAPASALVQADIGPGKLEPAITGPGSSTKIGAAAILASVAIASGVAEEKTPIEELKGLMSMAGDIVAESMREGGRDGKADD